MNLLLKPRTPMASQIPDLIQTAYAAFNARDIDAVFATMQPTVRWSKAWEGNYANGYDEVRAYWTRQWKEINPKVEPVKLTERADGRMEVEVHQTVHDLTGNLLFDGPVTHIYGFENGLIISMDIEQQ